MSKIKSLTMSIEDMALDTPYKDGDFDAVKVKNFVEVAPGGESVWTHNMGRIPNDITPFYSNRALNYPEVVRRDAYTVVLKFIPDLVGTYTSKKFLLGMRFA